MEYYTTTHLISMFGVSAQTIKVWAREFAGYLSPTARPERGHVRKFTADDVAVFSLVNAYRKQSYRWEDAHVALKRGDRGEIPDPGNEIVKTVHDDLKELEMAQIKQQLVAVSTERDELRGQVKLYDKLLMTLIGEKDRQIQELTAELERIKATQVKH